MQKISIFRTKNSTVYVQYLFFDQIYLSLAQIFRPNMYKWKGEKGKKGKGGKGEKGERRKGKGEKGKRKGEVGKGERGKCERVKNVLCKLYSHSLLVSLYKELKIITFCTKKYKSLLFRTKKETNLYFFL